MKSFSEVLAKFPAEVQQRYDFSGAMYTGALARIQNVVCPVHGVFSQYAAQFRKGRGCPACGDAQRAISRRTPQEEYFEKVATVHAGKYDYSESKFTRMNAMLDVRCPTHGVFSISANHHFYRRQGCGMCEQEARKARIVQYRHLSAQAKIDNTAKTFFERCTAAHEGRYTYPEQVYAGAKEKIRIVCPVHGEFEQAAWAHLAGKGCQKCGAADPKWEREIVAFVEGLGFSIVRSAPVLDGRHIDVYVPEHKFGIELHGLHWHTESKRDKDYHRQKWAVAQAQGVRLVQVFEDEWLQKQQIVKARIAAMLGRCERFDARKCCVEVLDSASARAFLHEHHIQGAGNARVYYGLRLQDRLVAVASFCPARSGAMTGAGKEGVWEILRYASAGRVRGGFTRMYKRFLQDYAPQQVISYCDLRYGDGRLYAAAGLTLDSVTEPDYWWVPAGKIQRIPRYTTQKHKLQQHPVLGAFYQPGMTEAQVCHAAGWERIYGVGNQRWVWRA